jgi:hypothetical protein
MTVTPLTGRVAVATHEPRGGHLRRATTWGSAVYVAAWVVGLLLKPQGVSSTDSAAVIVGDYVRHRVVSIAQVLLVHAVAAGAVLLFAFGIAGLAEVDGRRRIASLGRRCAAAVATTSLIQAIVGMAAIATAGSAAPSRTRALLIAVERLDAFKLVALAGMCAVGVSLARAGLLARWTGHVATAALGCLLAAASGLSGVAPALAAAAAPALVLLLAWVGGVPFVVRRLEA